MTHFQKLRLLNWVSLNLYHNSLRSPPACRIFGSVLPFCSVHNQFRFYGLRAVQVQENDGSNGESHRRISPAIKLEAQKALMEYLHSTRYFQFLDAEHMSKNSPHFLKKLIKHVVDDDPSVARSMTRFLRYHPINEFEPFFESIGLRPSEFAPFLPRDLMFLSDEEGLLDNYHVLCEYGVARKKIGRIYREAREVFQYDRGVLQSKLQALEVLGVGQPTIAKVISYSPPLLVGDVGKEFVEVVKKLKCLGIEFDWVEKRLLEKTSFNWRQIFELLRMLSDLGCDKKDIGRLIGQHPELLFDDSGRKTFSLIGLVLKFGSTKNDIRSMFLHFPSVKVGKFLWNLRRVSDLFVEIEMDNVSIGRIIRPHLALMGTLPLKRANSVLAGLNTGKKRLCDIIKANPLELQKWVLRAKIERLPDDQRSHMEKIKFLSSIGFEENSKPMERALKAFRGKGEELQERFDCLVKAGLQQEDVSGMIKAAPQVLNQSKEVLEAKIGLLVNDLGYPLSSVKSFPAFLSYTMGRVKLRHAMFKWLSDQGLVHSSLSLSTIVACTEPYFLRRYVKKHPRGREMWQELKKTTTSV